MNDRERAEIARQEQLKAENISRLRVIQQQEKEDREFRARLRSSRPIQSKQEAVSPLVIGEKKVPYSQLPEEEEAILKACQKKPGKFLDIGAWHPTKFSNTRALFEKGWTGVMIEPSPQPMLNLLEAYGNDERITLVQAAVALESGLIKIHVSDDAVSTTRTEEYEKWKDHAKFRGVMQVPGITWEFICNRFGGFQFVNIDAEGLSVNLFFRMTQLVVFPPVVCVEHESRLEELSSHATRHAYVLVYSNGTNAIFRRE